MSDLRALAAAVVARHVPAARRARSSSPSCRRRRALIRWRRSASRSSTWVVSLARARRLRRRTRAGFQFNESRRLDPGRSASSTSVGVDGLSLALVVLTTTLTWISILASFGPIQTRVKEYMISFLILEVGMIGVFVALDLFLFYIFWELVLVPMYLIIGIWGGTNRIYATIKFVLYTLVGSLLMLVAILATAFTYQAAHGGAWAGAFDFETLQRVRRTGAFGGAFQFLAFARLLPRLRDQGPDVPVPHLAARRPRRGADGGLGDPGRRAAQARRLRLHPVRPAAVPGRGRTRWAPLIIVLSLIAIIYGAIVAIVQPDLKKLVAYSSVSHMGFVTLGIFVFQEQGMQGAILQMVNHGLITGALFLLVGVIYERTHDRTIAKMGGLGRARPRSTPRRSASSCFASAGLPGPVRLRRRVPDARRHVRRQPVGRRGRRRS